MLYDAFVVVTNERINSCRHVSFDRAIAFMSNRKRIGQSNRIELLTW